MATYKGAVCKCCKIVLRKVTVRAADNVLYLYCLFLALAVEVLRALAARVIGMRFSFLNAVLYGALPRALLTGLWALLFMTIFKPLLKRQVDNL